VPQELLGIVCFGEAGQATLSPGRFALVQPNSNLLLCYPDDGGLRRRWEIYQAGLLVRHQNGPHAAEVAALVAKYANQYLPYRVLLPESACVKVIDVDGLDGDFHQWRPLTLAEATLQGARTLHEPSLGKHFTMPLPLRDWQAYRPRPYPMEHYQGLPNL